MPAHIAGAYQRGRARGLRAARRPFALAWCRADEDAVMEAMARATGARVDWAPAVYTGARGRNHSRRRDQSVWLMM